MGLTEAELAERSACPVERIEETGPVALKGLNEELTLYAASRA